MDFEKVLNPEKGTVYPVKPMAEVPEEEFRAMYEGNLPQGKFKSPYVDDMCVFLYNNPPVLNTIQHYLKSYHTLTPVFVSGHKLYPMEFGLGNMMNGFLRSVLRDGDKLPNWKWIVRQSLLKLSGHFGTFSGVD